MENIIRIDIINRGLIDKRRTHLEDVYVLFEPNKLERGLPLITKNAKP